MANVENEISDAQDVGDLHGFGYRQSLRRSIGSYGSFAVAFSMISITTAVFFLLPSLFSTVGGVGVWLWVPCSAGIFMIVLVYAHLAARIPITGFAYQWNSRLVSPHYGWFTGWTAFLAFCAGTASIATALSAVFAGNVWAHPTHANLVTFALVMILAAGLINIVSIRVVSTVNNAAVGFEIVGSVGAAALLFIGSLFFFHHDQAGFSILTQAGPVGGGSATWYGFALAALLPLTTFLGWEGAADLAEETTDPRSITPRAMIRANYTSVAASFFMIVGFMIAIPHGVKDLVNQPGNALIYTFQSHFGSVAGDVLQVVVFISIFSCLLANMVVATRMTFSLARDKMLPGSSMLGRVYPRTRTPMFAILLVAAIAAGVNLLSAGIASNVVSITAAAYYATYCLTVGAALWAFFRNKVPSARVGDFSLGRWARPVAVVAFLYAAGVVLDILAPQGGHIAMKYLAGAELVGVLWYVLYLRRRINRGAAGIGRAEVLSPSDVSTRSETGNTASPIMEIRHSTEGERRSPRSPAGA
jgi:amino acid transporter